MPLQLFYNLRVKTKVKNVAMDRAVRGGERGLRLAVCSFTATLLIGVWRVQTAQELERRAPGAKVPQAFVGGFHLGVSLEVVAGRPVTRTQCS